MHAGPGHLLFVEPTGDWPSQMTLANGEMEEVARLTADREVSEHTVVVSPDRQTFAVGSRTTAYLVSIESSRISVLFEPDPDARNVRMWIDTKWKGPTVHVVFSHVVGTKEEARQHVSDHFFNWEGEPVLRPACPSGGAPSTGWAVGSAWTSPDGRYVAWLDGGPAFTKYVGFARLDDPWPSLVIADAATCVPLFRVRSARTGELWWNAEWLATSEGIVVGTHDGYVIVRIRPEPEIVPFLRGGGTWGAWQTGPQPAPTGDGRYFGYDCNVYDAFEGRWVLPSDAIEDDDHGRGRVPESGGGSPCWWGDSHRERWSVAGEGWGEGWVEWLLLPPKIEFPPFSEEIAFRVARTSDCLHLRSEPDTDGEILDCLRDGARVVFVRREYPEGTVKSSYYPASVHPSIGLDERRVRSAPVWVYVRTEDGVEGWVSHDYLEHD
ncbi:MAG: SH3 domain-containing protein [Chloroflexota bacterium]|nr:SH3 domain-containing protein [Chloroflexota bacterium]